MFPRPTSWSIKQRIVSLSLAPAITIALALIPYFMFLRYGDVDSALTSRGAAMARQLAPAAEYGAFSGNRAELLRLLNAVAAEEDVAAVSLHDPVGNLLTSVGNRRLEGNVAALPDGWQGLVGDGGIEAFHAKIYRYPLAFDDPFQPPAAADSSGKLLGSVTLEMSRARLMERKREILIVTLMTTLAVLVAATLIALRLGQRTLDALAEAHENLLARKEEADRANRAKSRFLAATSHDLRQPLHALILFAAEIGVQATTPEQRRLSAQIGTAAGAMGELLDALLDVSRLDTGDIVPHPQPVALEPLLEEVTAAHRESARLKGLRLTLRPTTAWVESDPHLLRRMCSNLVANAVRYTRQGGVLVGVRRSGGDMRIDVWDTGIGIEPDHLPHIFQEFYQVGNPERDAAKGLGLGLAITQHLGRILGHEIRVRTRPGRGSLFSILLPEIIPGALAEEPLPAPPSGARIRIASPDADLRRNLCGLLLSWGYQAMADEPGACETPDVDLVILDGPESIPPPAAGPRPLRVLLGDKPATPAQSPVDGHLQKPPKPAQLRALLHHLLIEREEDEDCGDGALTPP